MCVGEELPFPPREITVHKDYWYERDYELQDEILGRYAPFSVKLIDLTLVCPRFSCLFAQSRIIPTCTLSVIGSCCKVHHFFSARSQDKMKVRLALEGL